MFLLTYDGGPWVASLPGRGSLGRQFTWEGVPGSPVYLGGGPWVASLPGRGSLGHQFTWEGVPGQLKVEDLWSRPTCLISFSIAFKTKRVTVYQLNVKVFY
jgi:hypothetical protein